MIEAQDTEKIVQELCFQGIPVCPGVAIGELFLLNSTIHTSEIKEEKVPFEKVDQEVSRYYKALQDSQSDIISLKSQTAAGIKGEIVTKILEAHLDIMKDPLITRDVAHAIRKVKKNAEFVFQSVMGEFEQKFKKSISKPFFMERLQDIQDVSRRIIKNLRARDTERMSSTTCSFIIFADQLLPSDTMEADLMHIKGFVTRVGAHTSHTAIIARSGGIPYVVGIDLNEINGAELNKATVIVDGMTGRVIFNPTEYTVTQYRQEQQMLLREKNHEGLQALSYQVKQSVRKKENLISISANLDTPDDLGKLQAFHPKVSIGLFRSEFVVLSNRQFPSEEEQTALYTQMIRSSPDAPVIRLFDIGADKVTPEIINEAEINPALGCRGIRWLLRHEDILVTQLKSLWRASVFGKIQVLLPMITDVEEVKVVKLIVNMVHDDLVMQGCCLIRANLSIGSMIEVPSAVITAEALAQECGFLSLGTNDLSQYTLASDRDNASVRCYPLHPAIVRMIALTVDAAKKANVPLSVCGEAAGSPLFLPLLFGLGIRKISASLTALPGLFVAAELLEVEATVLLAQEALKLSSYDDLEALLRQYATEARIKNKSKSF
ncbi:Phosphoenolpyruvate-protein phosphotransferase [Candidatus Clavichlamydia salmonicola]|uniref:phosphoenolpyruvate--protein phosphotransferase n=1 Tax=Candidatus Clavichlamydia salmonicola TaxID=469812 RepID=UPI00189148D0|nr:phosphoenolpyruvate--protein phosphotransferase [Candidatus Clavichlamydia salmonicola]MBF5050930.1 Phosphoenolpyruvate-protein phosphotransferase [Candidatus Clavichlamydia salmonicola]